MSKTIKTLFTLSVLFNVMLLGAGAGYAFKKWHHAPGPWQEAKKDLSPQSQELMARNFQKMHEDMRPLFDDMKKSREELRHVMMQSDFNSQQFDAAMQRMRALRQQIGEKMGASAKEIAAQLSPEERKKMADRIIVGFDAKHRFGMAGPWPCQKSAGIGGVQGAEVTEPAPAQ